MISVSEALRLLPDSKKSAARLWAGYSLTWLTLGASASNAKATVTTQDDSDFIAIRMKAYATDNAAPPAELPSPQATLTLSIGSNSMFPDGNPVSINDFVVNANDHRGHDFEYPVWVARQTTLTGLLTNLTASAMNVRITLFGIRIFDYPNS